MPFHEESVGLLTRPLTCTHGPQFSAGGSPWGLGFILFTQVAHGISYFAVFAAVALRINITCFHLSNTEILALSTSFYVVSYVTNLIGGWYADTRAGRYWTIFFANLINLIGSLMKTAVAIVYSYTTNKEDFPVSVMLPIYIASLMFMAVSRGFILPSMVPFGAQQVDQSDDARLSSYFRWTIVSFDIGKYFVYCPLAFIIYVYDLDPILVCTIVELVAEALAWAVLVLGKSAYVTAPTTEGEKSMKEITKAFSKNILNRSVSLSPEDAMERMSLVHEPPDPQLMKLQRLKLRKMFLMGGIFTIAGVFSAVNLQGTTTYLVQGEQLKGDSPAIPHLFVASFAPLTVIVLSVLTEVYTWCCSRRTGYRFWELKMIVVGTIFAVLSLASADYIEIIWRIGREECSKFCQIPQFVFLGLAEFFFYIPGFEFCYRESFAGLESTTTGFFFGVGSFFAMVIFLIFIPLGTVPMKIGLSDNKGFFLELFSALGGLMLLTMLVLLFPLTIWYTRVRKSLKDNNFMTAIITTTDLQHVQGTNQDVDDTVLRNDRLTETVEGESPDFSDQDIDLMSRYIQGEDLVDERDLSPSLDLGRTSDEDT
ncbi:solute carrier family 15 member 4-like [Lineus longissimus]|uniref:solute carrier family 15 member 4-like n=1 Tax=Lineus longissimus TaxID=88925 RepID=UPI00315D7660